MNTRNCKMNAVIAGIVICTAAFFSVGCGRKSGVSDKQIRQDIETEITDISTYGLKIDNIDTEKRQTSKNNGTDSLWADITASNEHCTYTVYCEMFYSLYNSGWFLDGINILETEIIPRVPAEEFPQSDADRAVEEMGYSNYWLEDRNEYTDRIDFKYGAYDADGTEMVVSMNYEFSPERGWYQFTSSSLSANLFSR